MAAGAEPLALLIEIDGHRGRPGGRCVKRVIQHSPALRPILVERIDSSIVHIDRVCFVDVIVSRTRERAAAFTFDRESQESPTQ